MNTDNHFIGQFLAMSEFYLRMTENNAMSEISANDYEEFNEAINVFTEFYNTSDQSLS